MGRNESTTDLERALSQALDELQAALSRAGEAAASIQAMLPRLAAAGSLLEEIESLARAGRERIGAAARAETVPQAAYTRPTLVVPRPETPRPAPELRTSGAAAAPPSRAPEPEAPAPSPPAGGADAGGLVSFRLEFESTPGPLDLRTVDDAVSEHPAVRDVALLDYDGRRATLKVWVVDTASAADVQEALRERATELFGEAHDVSIVALEDVA